MPISPYDTDLDRNPANFQPLSPLPFLERATSVFPNHVAVIHGGGKQLTTTAEKLGVSQRIINGRRVTDDETLEIAKMVFAG